MRVKRIARITAILILFVILGGNLWQCARDTTSSLITELGIILKPAGVTDVEYDKAEIEVWDGAGFVTADTVDIVAGSFQSTLAVDPGGPYQIKAFASGLGNDLIPSSQLMGIVAIGESGDVNVSAGEVTDPVVVTMDNVITGMTAVSGNAGESTLEMTWPSVPRAISYSVGWYVSDATTGRQDGFIDTTATIDWSGTKKQAFLAEFDDSVLFRVQPHFTERTGVFGEGIWVTPAIWMDLPQVTSFDPAPLATVDADTVQLWIKFDREIDQDTLTEGLWWLQMINDQPVEVVVESISSPATGLYQVVPNRSTLLRGYEQQIILKSTILDLEGRAFDAEPTTPGLQDAVYNWSTAAYDPLHIIASRPEAGERDVDPTIAIRLKLNRPYNPATLVDSVCFLTDPAGETIPGLLTSTLVDSIYFTPADQLWFDNQYDMHITPELLDQLGRPFDQNLVTETSYEPYDFHFTTMAQPMGPKVLISTPADGDNSVYTGVLIQITFSLPIDPASVVAGQSFKLLREGTVNIGGTISITGDDKVLTFKPTSLLNQNKSYLVRLTSDITGISGVPLDQDMDTVGYQEFTATFHTEDPPMVLSVSPLNSATAVPVGTTVNLSFSRVLDPAALPSANIKLLLSETDVPCTQTLATDSLLLTLTPETELSTLSTYTVQVDTLLRSADGSYFDQDLGLAKRQPFDSFFITKPESLHPRVTAITPADQALDVWVGDSVAVIFSLPMNPVTFNTSSSFVLNKVEGETRTQVPGAFSLSLDQITATFIPTNLLSYGQVFEMAISTDIGSISGFELDQDATTEGLQPYASTFTTIQEQVSPYVLYIQQPLPDAVDVDVTTLIVLQFSEAMNSDSLTAAFSVKSGDVTVPGTGILDGTGIHWVFTPTDPLSFETTYTTSVSTSACDLVGNPLDQDSETPDLQPLEFSFTTEIDETPPQVVSIIPVADSTGVNVFSTVTATFTEAMKASTFSSTSFQVRKAQAGSLAQGTVALTNNNKTVVWTPVAESPLAFSTQYIVVADTVLTDESGNLLDQFPSLEHRQIYSSFFTTMVETIPPQVTAVYPLTNPMPIDSEFTILFSEAMSTAALNTAGVIKLSPAVGEDVAFSLTIAASGDSATMVPSASLASQTTYTLSVDTLATDLIGNLLDNDLTTPHRQAYTRTFITEIDEVGPRVISVVPDSGLVHINTSSLSPIQINFSESIQTGTIHSGSVYLQGATSGFANSLITFENSNRRVILTPDPSLSAGEQYYIMVNAGVRDPMNNQLDQDPDTVGNQTFSSPFGTGAGAVINWTGNQCPMGMTALVDFDASNSIMPDSSLYVGYPDSIVSAVWLWGDGNSDSLAAPAGLQADHLYDLFDYDGCDSLDNDEDGVIDETGIGGCDESYEVILRLWDAYGFSTVDTTGVSFCAYLVRSNEPADNATGVSNDSNVILRFTRTVLEASVTPSSILFTNEGNSVAYTTTYSDGGRMITLNPAQNLSAGVCSVTVDTTVRAGASIYLDQDLETADRQQLKFRFTVPE